MCYNCGEQGHIQRFCSKPRTICGYCRSTEHDTEECAELLAKLEAKRGNIHMVVVEPCDTKDQHLNVNVIVKLGKQNVGPDHLSRIQSGEHFDTIDDALPDSQLFRVGAIQDQFADIVAFLITGCAPKHLTINQKKQPVTHNLDFQLIGRQLYKLGSDGILCDVCWTMNEMSYYERHMRVL